MIWTVISVSKEDTHEANHIQDDTKKNWIVSYLNEYGKIAVMKVNFLKALFYKTKVRKEYKFFCEECGNIVKGDIKSLKSQIKCPYCDE